MLLSILAAAATWLIASPALARDSGLQQAIGSYELGEYDAATRGLSEALAAGIDDPHERLEAREYLAAAWHAKGDEPRARRMIEQILGEDREATVDAALFPPRFVELFGSVRASLPAPTPAPKEEPKPRPTTGEPLVVVPPPPLALAPKPPSEPPSLALAFVPFGVGQFANGSPRKGAFFLAGETIAFGSFAVALTAFESKKLPGSPGLFQCTATNPCRFSDASQASRLQTVYLASLYTGAALTVLGIAEAVIENRSLAEAAESPSRIEQR
jgi:hypothetical protein